MNIPETPPLLWTNEPGLKLFKCIHLPSTAAEARAKSYICYLCGKVINKEQPVIVLDKPIDIPALTRYVQAGKLCIADVFGYRSDLRVVMVTGDLFMLRPPDGTVFNTDARYVSRVTVS